MKYDAALRARQFLDRHGVMSGPERLDLLTRMLDEAFGAGRIDGMEELGRALGLKVPT